MNLYGPTEATVYSAMDDVTHAARITVGKIYPNCRGYILDESMRPVMPTAIGELYLAGECLAAGYIGEEELTKAAFLAGSLLSWGNDVSKRRYRAATPRWQN